MSVIHTEYQQGSEAWLTARAGIPTASEFDQLITAELKPRAWSTAMPNTYLARKLAEYWIGRPMISYKGAQTDQGNILEEQAIPWYEQEFNIDVQRVGMVTTDDGRIGCSPDGLIGEDGGVEIKCPEAPTHVRYLLDGVVPKDYLPQVYGNLYVTGRKWWRFVSYRRHFPKLVIKVNRDEKEMAAIEDVLEDFLSKFDQGIQKLELLNKGPSMARKSALEMAARLAKDPPKFSWDQDQEGVTP